MGAPRGISLHLSRSSKDPYKGAYIDPPILKRHFTGQETQELKSPQDKAKSRQKLKWQRLGLIIVGGNYYKTDNLNGCHL